MSLFLFYAPELHLNGTHDFRALFVFTDIPSYRAGIGLHGFRHRSTQVGGIHHKDPVWMD